MHEACPAVSQKLLFIIFSQRVMSCLETHSSFSNFEAPQTLWYIWLSLISTYYEFVRSLILSRSVTKNCCPVVSRYDICLFTIITIGDLIYTIMKYILTSFAQVFHIQYWYSLLVTYWRHWTLIFWEFVCFFQWCYFFIIRDSHDFTGEIYQLLFPGAFLAGQGLSQPRE